MQNKLQELTDKLYQEGLSKGKQEANELLSKAKKEAEDIVKKAHHEASAIIEAAKKQALELQANAENELKMAARQSMAALKLEIEKLVITKVLSKPLSQAVSDTEFLKTLIKTAVEAFQSKSNEAVSLDVLLPESLKKELDGFLATQVEKQLGASITATFDNKLKTGFTVASKEEGYQLRFTDADFEALFSEYLRPKTRTLLFG